MRIEAFAPAKINLALHVTGQRRDGYHLIDSVVLFADIGDRLWLEAADKLSLAVTGPFAHGVPDGTRNLAWRAAELAGWQGRIRIEKALPHGAGIGGGSADAAAVLRALGAQNTGVSLGADVPVCKAAKAARMRGIGEALTPLPHMPGFPAVLINPGCHVATGSVFQALVRRDNPGLRDIPATGATAADWIAWLAAQRNDLQGPAQQIAPPIKQVLNSLAQSAGVQLARMSGSGATCFGLYETSEAAEAAGRDLQSAHPEAWVKVTTLR